GGGGFDDGRCGAGFCPVGPGAARSGGGPPPPRSAQPREWVYRDRTARARARCPTTMWRERQLTRRGRNRAVAFYLRRICRATCPRRIVNDYRTNCPVNGPSYVFSSPPGLSSPASMLKFSAFSKPALVTSSERGVILRISWNAAASWRSSSCEKRFLNSASASAGRSSTMPTASRKVRATPSHSALRFSQVSGLVPPPLLTQGP